MNTLEKFTSIKTFVFDVDGVLTDGSLLILEDGQMARRMNIKDGYAIQLAVKKGYRVVIISGGTSEAVKERLARLGVKDCFVKIDDKKAKLIEYVNQHNLLLNEILFMGDDMPDYFPMQLTGLPCCPADAATEIKQISLYVSPLNGGSGCARDVIEKVLKLNGHWDTETGIAAR
ncbi:MAG: 3-deoxy-D-manno-octulosonate 8-phosphate phosphatase [Ferruginibacter sp.]|nr:3-deoxy-D-manno-octulosonate 8-phosphate phosphatase [Bacteroidota bacterium]MBX2918658.1 3-deoxy-D-manno-octulosonate 8-phosphate phosphatase [Ferruginibacter sp.]MCB0708193.1 3-deoxy-D-manno-octulosonate 8-phosphate phosphatase [Chitinophagaceae bacterium]MCC7378802.1 3-deoxy-D-manno-octulosonate 8-phosphate phosphatase [Chitinophagaceae bacterium]